LALRPDLVIGVHIQAAHAPAFAAAGIPFFMTESMTFERTLTTITDIGAMLGRVNEARQLTERIAGVEARIAAMPRERDPSALIIWGAPGTFMFALPNSFAGDLLRRVGGVNVAQDMATIPGQPTFANFSMERVVQHNPDFILIVAHGDAQAVRRAFVTQMQNDPAWRTLTAAREGRVHILPFDLFGVNPGSRLGEALEHLASILYDSH
jgi:iron complex transport system substrate-binding protein